MKTTLTILLISAAIIITACKSLPTSNTDIVVLRDFTDSSITSPKAGEIINLYDFTQSKWNGADFKFLAITDVSYNHTETVRIEPKNRWLSNEFERASELKQFETDLTDILVKTEQTAVGKNSSSVYFPLAIELTRLSQSKTNRRILLLFSDLLENSQTVSFYRKSDLTLLKSRPEAVKEKFEKLLPLPDLSGIEIFIIYKPTAKNDELFRMASDLFKSTLEEKGAKVTITANL